MSSLTPQTTHFVTWWWSHAGHCVDIETTTGIIWYSASHGYSRSGQLSFCHCPSFDFSVATVPVLNLNTVAVPSLNLNTVTFTFFLQLWIWILPPSIFFLITCIPLPFYMPFRRMVAVTLPILMLLLFHLFIGILLPTVTHPSRSFSHNLHTLNRPCLYQQTIALPSPSLLLSWFHLPNWILLTFHFSVPCLIHPFYRLTSSRAHLHVVGMLRFLSLT